MTRIVLGYSGSLDTSVAIPWLADVHKAEIVALTLDIGQRADLTQIRQRALACGALRAHVIDARDELVRDFVLPALQAGALDEDRHSLAMALIDTLIGKRLIEVARMEGASAIATGEAADTFTEKGRAYTGHVPSRIDVAARAFDPSVTVLTPARSWGLSLPDKIGYARRRNIPVPVSAETKPGTSTNLWIRSTFLEDHWSEPSDDVYALTRVPGECPDQPAYIEIEFEAGVPVRANGIEMSTLELIESLETIAGAHGVGRIDVADEGLTGETLRAVCEAPAAVVLHAAHKELESLIVTRNIERLKRHLGREYADLVYRGLWSSDARQAIDAFARTIQPRITGSVRVKLFKGNCQVVGRRSTFGLYDHRHTPFHAGDRFEDATAEGVR